MGYQRTNRRYHRMTRVRVNQQHYPPLTVADLDARQREYEVGQEQKQLLEFADAERRMHKQRDGS